MTMQGYVRLCSVGAWVCRAMKGYVWVCRAM